MSTGFCYRVRARMIRHDCIYLSMDILFVDVNAMAGAEHQRRDGYKDIAVVGFDYIPLAKHCTSPLTTIRLPGFGLKHHPLLSGWLTCVD